MPTDDALTLEQYRRVLDEAARELTRKAGETTGRKVASATGAVFAALARRDERERAMLEIVRFVAGCDIGPRSRRLLMWQYDDADVYVEMARRIVAESEVRG